MSPMTTTPGEYGARFGVLGPFEVRAHGEDIELDGPRLRVVLASLVAGAGRVVGVDAIAEQLWQEHPPPDAHRSVRTYVSLLRKAFRPAADLIVTRPPGYLLAAGPGAVDADEFERLAADGRRALAGGEPVRAAEDLAAAARLWRGDAYGEFRDAPALRAEAVRLDQLRLAATEDRIDADLATGAGGELVAELEVLLGAHPGHERLWGQLITALYRAGRQSDALGAYRRARDTLIENSGLEPSPALTEIHRQVLTQDPRLRPTRTVTESAPLVRLAQLPRAVGTFTGRADEVAELDMILADATASGSTAAAVICVFGMGGIGKTTLAMHWAHRVVDQFPDGQLYVNLRGFDQVCAPTSPGEAICGFLHALGVPDDRVPAGLDAQAALYRSLLDGRRMLVVLDNARDAEQVRPLLPGTPSCLVIVTSRDQLTPLVAADGAHPISLDLLSTVESTELLGRRIGTGRLVAEPAAVAEIIGRCARLPLALSIVAARAATHRAFSLASIAAELADAGGSLDTLAAGDPTTDLPAVFAASYRALSEPAARLFRLLGRHLGPEIGAPAVASVAGVTREQARTLLAELTRASLLCEHIAGRYTCHDLLRAYAADLPDADSAAALGRLLDHYVHTAYAAGQWLSDNRDPIRLAVATPAAGVTAEPVNDARYAVAWFNAEYPSLSAAQRMAAEHGFDVHTWQLAWTMEILQQRRGRWHDLAGGWQVGLAAARRLDDPNAQSYAHRSLAYAYSRLGRFPDAHAQMRHALDLYPRTGDAAEHANTHQNLALLWGMQDRFDEAIDHSRRALDLYEVVGDYRGVAYALNSIGWYHAQRGDQEAALVHCRRALKLFQGIDHPGGLAATWDSLGFVHHQLGQHAESARCYRRAIDLYVSQSDRYNEAQSLSTLGDVHRANGDHDGARTAWQEAFDILADLNHPEADDVLRKLNELVATSTC